MTPIISIEREGDVRILRLVGGENRFNRDSVDAIHAALDEIESVEGPVALVTTGEGKFFSNGLDLAWMGTHGGDDPGFLGDVHRLLVRVLLLDMITVAAVNGHAFAAGAMLATAHDHRIMREDRGFWCLPEVDLGLPLTPVMFAVLEARLPRAALAESALLGRRYGGTAALEAGLVDATAPAELLLERAVHAAAEGATKDRSVIRAHKELLHHRVRSVADLSTTAI